jgi:DNA polymerase III subunit beta
MALTISKDSLFDVLQKAYPIIPLKSSLQILSNFRISFNGSMIEITTTDLDQSLKIFLHAEALDSKSFDITVNARKFFEIVRELPQGMVSFSVEDNVVLLQTEKNFSCKIAGADSNDFPGFPDVSNDHEIEINPVLLKTMIPNSSFAVAKDESRACLAGIFWEVSKDSTGMIATDGHRLGSCFINDSFSCEDKISVIASPKTLNNLLRNVDAKQDTKIKVLFSEKYVTFVGKDFTFCSKLIDGPYPDYTKVIPASNPREAVVDRIALLNATKRASILSNQKTHLIKFIFSENTMEVIVVNKEIGGEAKEKVSIEYKGDVHTIGFNGQYFTEILDIIKTEKVKISMNTQISACLLYPVHKKEEEKTSSDLFLIMPLRIMEA